MRGLCLLFFFLVLSLIDKELKAYKRERLSIVQREARPLRGHLYASSTAICQLLDTQRKSLSLLFFFLFFFRIETERIAYSKRKLSAPASCSSLRTPDVSLGVVIYYARKWRTHELRRLRSDEPKEASVCETTELKLDLKEFSDYSL